MDRKKMIREYKNTPRPMGIYQVRNMSNGKVLIGSSRNLPARLNRFRAELQIGCCRYRALQQDWNEYGPEMFEFSVLELLEPSESPTADPAGDLRVLEELWIEKLSPFGDRGYNERPKSIV